MKSFRFAPLRELLQLIIPESCVVCGKPLEGDERFLCVNCLGSLPSNHYSDSAGNATELRLSGCFPFVAATSFLSFRQGNETQAIVHRIKYYGNEKLGVYMGRMFGVELLASHRFDDVDCIMPVPLHCRKQRRRGYNQSLLLCKGISEVLGKDVENEAVARVVPTETQTHKTRTERFDNMSNAFKVVNPQRIEGRHILLVDDVLTTGSTISECAETILTVPSTKVSVATLSITVG